MSVAYAIEPPQPAPTSSARIGDVDTLIVSDLHLGLPAARPRDLLEVARGMAVQAPDPARRRAPRLELPPSLRRHLAPARAHPSPEPPARGRGGLGAGQPRPSSGPSRRPADRDRDHRIVPLAATTAARSWPCTATGSTRSSRRYARVSEFLSARLRLHAALAVRRGEWPKRLDRAHVGFSKLSASGRGRRARLCQRATRST